MIEELFRHILSHYSLNTISWNIVTSPCQIQCHSHEAKMQQRRETELRLNPNPMTALLVLYNEVKLTKCFHDSLIALLLCEGSTLVKPRHKPTTNNQSSLAEVTGCTVISKISKSPLLTDTERTLCVWGEKTKPKNLSW